MVLVMMKILAAASMYYLNDNNGFIHNRRDAHLLLPKVSQLS